MNHEDVAGPADRPLHKAGEAGVPTVGRPVGPTVIKDTKAQRKFRISNFEFRIFLCAFVFLWLMFALAAGAPQQPARAAAPIDLTGYWVSVVSEDWRHRMATPRKGDYESL